MKLLHVDSSAKGEWSNSRALSRYFVERLKERLPHLEVDYLDVHAEPPPHVSGEFARATYTPDAERTPEMRETLAYSDAICARLLSADALLFAMPMYNWCMPSTFKAFIDAITRTGITYGYNDAGMIVGKLLHEKVLFLTTRGADLRPGSPYADMDGLTPALKAAYKFIGVNTPSFVDAQPLQFADQAARGEALVRAQRELDAIAAEWATAGARGSIAA